MSLRQIRFRFLAGTAGHVTARLAHQAETLSGPPAVKDAGGGQSSLRHRPGCGAPRCPSAAQSSPTHQMFPIRQLLVERFRLLWAQ